MHKVLAIDGDASSAGRITSALTESGFEVIVASSEPEGLKIVDEVAPDVIVVRDNHPHLDGFKLCQIMRRLFDLPLILLGDKPSECAYSADLEIPTAWNYYMHLPIDYRELATRINVLLWRYGKAELPCKQ